MGEEKKRGKEEEEEEKWPVLGGLSNPKLLIIFYLDVF